MKLEGFNELSKQLKNLGSKVGGVALRSALNVASTPIVQEARRNAPKGTREHRTYKGRLVAPGFLSRSVKKKTFKSKSGRFASVWIGVDKEAYYGTQFVERGTKKMEKKEWLEPAIKSKESEVIKRFESQLIKNINKQLK